MHTVELLEEALETARRAGYQVRQEYLGGAGGGACEFGGRKWIFVDLALTLSEQLDEVLAALREDPAIHAITLPTSLNRLLGTNRRAA